jgi:hypothetical protein
MGLNIICYLQHPNQTYIPMSMILWYYVLQKGGMKQLMSRLFILQICNLPILTLQPSILWKASPIPLRQHSQAQRLKVVNGHLTKMYNLFIKFEKVINCLPRKLEPTQRTAAIFSFQFRQQVGHTLWLQVRF